MDHTASVMEICSSDGTQIPAIEYNTAHRLTDFFNNLTSIISSAVLYFVRFVCHCITYTMCLWIKAASLCAYVTNEEMTMVEFFRIISGIKFAMQRSFLELLPIHLARVNAMVPREHFSHWMQNYIKWTICLPKNCNFLILILILLKFGTSSGK